MKKILLILIFLIGFFFVVNNSAYAESPIVRGYLIIPDNWLDRMTPELVQKYNDNILRGLKGAQDFYASKLPDRHTFNYDSEVKTNAAPVGNFDFSNEAPGPYYDEKSINNSCALGKKLVGSPRLASLTLLLAAVAITPVGVAGGLAGGAAGGALYGNVISLQLLASSVLPPIHSGETRVFFVVGTENIPTCAQWPVVDDGEVYINHQILEDLGSSDRAKGLLTKELGHAFGLIYAGDAKANTCSVVSKNDCSYLAFRKLPPASEYENSIMGNGWQRFPNASLNDTRSNPEIQRLMESPFINPNRLSWSTIKFPSIQLPSIQWPIFSKPKVQISSFSPNPLNIGSELTITGSGFGNFKEGISGIVLSNPNFSSDGSNLVIKKWEDSQIKISLESFPQKYLTTWNLSVKTDNGDNVSADQDLTILPPVPAVIPSASETLTSNFNPSAQSGAIPSPSDSPTPTPIPSITPSIAPPASLTENCIARGGECVGTTCLVDNDPSGSCDSTAQASQPATPIPTFTPVPTSTPNLALTSLATPAPISAACSLSSPGHFRYECNPDGTHFAIKVCDSGGESKDQSPYPGVNFTDENGVYYENCVAQNSTPNSQLKTQKSLVKIVVGAKEYTSDFTQTFSIDLRLATAVSPNIYSVPVILTFNDGSIKPLLYTFIYKPLTVETPTPAPADVALCNAKGGLCQASCSGEFSSQVGICAGTNQLCCVKPVVAPGISKCQGSGPAASGWGGSCKVGEPDRAVLANGGTACSVAACYLKSDINEYCWYNSGTPYPDYEGCKAKGVIISTPQPTSSACVPQQISPCNPVCDGTPATCGKPTTCTDSCGTTYTGKCNEC